jgi:glutathione S-transferase
MDYRLYHLAVQSDWAAQRVSGHYEVSTLGRSLAEEGFIHCSFEHQVQAIADLVYRGRSDVLLLEIDARLLRSPIKVEGPDGGEAYPHIYGPLNRDAVVHVEPLALLADGRLDLASAMS